MRGAATRSPLVCLFALLLISGSARGQWDPNNGDWLQSHSDDVRVMTWNIFDHVCSTAVKVEGFNNWTAVAVIVAGMQPDVLLLQEVGDNSGNGTGSGVDSVSNLETTIDLFLHGGTDPFNGGAVSAYVQKYAPGYDLPHVFVSWEDDNFNRNVVLSRYPFADLNGDTRSELADIPFVLPDAYAPSGDGGIRGFQFVEIDLPDLDYTGDLVIGNAHLKSGGSSSDKAQRLAAAQNVAYYVDYLLNGNGSGIPDPNNKIIDSPAATTILAAATPVILGGDWNENEATNGRDGPAVWLTRAEFTGGSDGTDRDRSDGSYDDAAHPITGSKGTRGSSKLDYLAWQDSIVTARREFIFNSAGLSSTQLPPEVNLFPLFPAQSSTMASDHLPVIIDFEMSPTSTVCQNDLGFMGPGSATLSICGETLDSGNNAELKVANAPAGKLLFLLAGVANLPTPFRGGTLVPVPPSQILAFVTNGAGELVLPVAGGGGPVTLYLQCVIDDPPQVFGLSLTNALEVVVGP